MMNKSDSEKDRVSELISGKDVKIIGDVIVAFPHKGTIKPFFRNHVEVDEKEWDQLIEEEDYEWIEKELEI